MYSENIVIVQKSMLSSNGNIHFEAYNLLITITVKVLRYFLMLYDVTLVLFMTRNPLSIEYLSRRKTVNMNIMVGCIVFVPLLNNRAFPFIDCLCPVHKLILYLLFKEKISFGHKKHYNFLLITITVI